MNKISKENVLGQMEKMAGKSNINYWCCKEDVLGQAEQTSEHEPSDECCFCKKTTPEMKIQKTNLIDCDQVAQIQLTLERYAEAYCNSSNHDFSRTKKTAKLNALLEIMVIVGMTFEDDEASGNALHELTEFNAMRFGAEYFETTYRK